MSDFVVAVFQLTGRSSRDGPAKSLAVGFGAFGVGVVTQAFANQLPHTDQISILDLDTDKRNRSVRVTFCF